MGFSRYGQGTVRNAALRGALKERWPDQKFNVRNGQNTWSSVTWVDGPLEGDVELALADVLAPDGYPWGASVYRQFSDELLAVAAWRARQSGDVDFYRELDQVTGRTLPEGSTPLHPGQLSARRCVEGGIDASSITAEERAAAAAILAITGPLHSSQHRRAEQIARTVVLHGHAVDGILT